MTPANPNVILVHCHDLGRHLGCHGRDVDTPHVDTLANDGALFERHFVTAPQCSPSRGSLHTGCHPHVHGLMGLAHGSWTLDGDIATLATCLADAGYGTHLFGLQHVTDDPASIGFEHTHPGDDPPPTAAPEKHDRYRAAGVAETVATFLKAGEHTEPFFASVGFFEAHRLEVNEHFGFNDGRYTDGDPETLAVPPFLEDLPGIRNDLAELEGMVEAIDAAVGRLLEALRSAGVMDDTLVVFTTEHGIAFPRAKGCVYDAGLEATLIARYPGVFEGGERYDALLSNVDLMPTILDLVDGAVPGSIDGRSFLGLVTDRPYDPRERIFAEMTWHDRYNPVRAIRTERYKYIRNCWHLPEVHLTNDVFVSQAGREVREAYHSGHRPYEELYDLEADPTERDSLADADAYEPVRSELEDTLVTWMRDTDDPLLEGPVPPGDYGDITPW